MNPKLEAIAACAADNLKAAVADGEKDILDAWAQAEAEAQLQDTAPKFKLGFTITLDLDKDVMTTDLAWSIKHKLTITRAMPEPDQLRIPGIEGATMTIKTGDTSVTVTQEQFERAAKKLSAQN